MAGRRKNMSREAILAKAAGLCARAEHSRAELAQKFRQWGADVVTASDVLDELERLGFVDDERFVQAFVSDKTHFDLWGRIRIRHELALRHGIRDDVVTAALNQIDEGEYVENLRRILTMKKSLIDETDPYKLKSKLYRYGVSRGYEPGLVLKLLPMLVDGGDEFENAFDE